MIMLILNFKQPDLMVKFRFLPLFPIPSPLGLPVALQLTTFLVLALQIQHQRQTEKYYYTEQSKNNDKYFNLFRNFTKRSLALQYIFIYVYLYVFYFCVLQIEAFKPFFVSLNLPYSVVLGEQLVLQANVFNYLTQDAFVSIL